MKSGAKEATSIRIDARLLAQLKKEAKEQNRSLSNYLETLLYNREYSDDTVEVELKEGQGRDMFTGEVFDVNDTQDGNE